MTFFSTWYLYSLWSIITYMSHKYINTANQFGVQELLTLRDLKVKKMSSCFFQIPL